MYQSSLSSNAPPIPASPTRIPAPSKPPHIIDPTAPHTHTIIFLHGRGSTASTFCGELFESETSSGQTFTALFPSAKWVFPCAPQSYSALDQEVVNQWFDMTSVQRPQEDVDVQKQELWASVEALRQIVKEEAELVGGMKNILLGGISQGCAVVMFTLLASGWKVGGVVGLSGWMPMARDMQDVMDVPGRMREFVKTPVLLQHCQDDGVMDVKNGEELKQHLEQWGMQVIWECFEEGGHWLNEPEGIDGIVRFLQACMATEAKASLGGETQKVV